jgi:hypothetical protein
MPERSHLSDLHGAGRRQVMQGREATRMTPSLLRLYAHQADAIAEIRRNHLAAIWRSDLGVRQLTA